MENKVDFVITDGSVEYKHSKPRAEYETVAPMVRLNFTVAEGSDPDVVVHKVMDMAVRHVEGTIVGKTFEPVVAPSEPEKPKRTRTPKVDVGADLIEGMENAVKAAQEGGNEDTSITLKGDIQPLAQKVSAHLAKVDGNINALRKIIKECGGNSLLTIPQENWPTFIVEAKKLLPAKE